MSVDDMGEDKRGSRYDGVLETLRRRLPTFKRRGDRKDRAVETSSAIPQPIVECSVEAGRSTKALKILLNILPLIPFALAALGLERTILFPASIVLAVIAFLVSPFLIDEDLRGTAENIALILSKNGLLEKWTCYDRRLFFTGYLKDGFVLSIFRRRLGVRYTLVLVRGQGAIMPPSSSPKPLVKVLSVYESRVIQGRGEPGLSLFSTQMTLADALVVFPHPLNPRLLSVYRGRTLLVTMPSVEVQEFLEEKGEELLKLFDAPRIGHPAL